MSFRLGSQFKTHRETENKVHEQLYKNVKLLTYIYPTTNDFKQVFKSDMFVKKNSAAFQHVIHYLLSVLDPVLLKQKVVTWPIYDPKSETQFRVETIKYLNELNGLYEDANLPAVLMSHVVSPGGLRFAKYMLKLSQLTLMQHLKREDSVLHRIHPNKNSDKTLKTIDRLNVLTLGVNEDTEKLRVDFEIERRETRAKAEFVVKELTEYCDLVPKLRKKLEKLQSEMNDDSINLNVVDTGEELIVLQEKLRKIGAVREKSDRVVEVMSSLLKKDLYFVYEAGMFPKDFATTSDELSLLAVLKKFNLLLNNKCLGMTPMNNADLEINVEKFVKLNEGLAKISRYLQSVNGKTVKLRMELLAMKKSQPMRKRPVKKFLQSQDSPEVLACPLDSTGESSLGILHFED